MPAMHGTQAVETMDPSGLEVPATQLLHVDVVAVYVPTAQLAQAPPATENIPGAQAKHAVDKTAPPFDVVPATQLVQLPSTTVVTYCPTSQLPHGLPPG